MHKPTLGPVEKLDHNIYDIAHVHVQFCTVMPCAVQYKHRYTQNKSPRLHAALTVWVWDKPVEPHCFASVGDN